MLASFDALPSEVLRSILIFMDVPSIAAISMTHKAADGNISSLAADDTTWFVLIQGRFGIDCNHRRSTRNKQKGVVLVKRSSSSSLSSERSNDQQRRKRRPKTYGGTTWKDAYRSLSSTMRIPETSITSGSSQMIGEQYLPLLPYAEGNPRMVLVLWLIFLVCGVW